MRNTFILPYDIKDVIEVFRKNGFDVNDFDGETAEILSINISTYEDHNNMFPSWSLVIQYYKSPYLYFKKGISMEQKRFSNWNNPLVEVNRNQLRSIMLFLSMTQKIQNNLVNDGVTYWAFHDYYFSEQKRTQYEKEGANSPQWLITIMNYENEFNSFSI